MFILIGYALVFGCVIGGFLLAGGHLSALWQPFEFLIIAGGAVGAFITGNDPKSVRAVLAALPKLFRKTRYSKAYYMELFSLLYELLVKIRKEGLMSVETDLDAPFDSSIFSKYPLFLADSRMTEFAVDYLRMMVGGNLNSFEIESLMDNELETHHQEHSIPPSALRQAADGLPAFGIVAAVMGVVHTMASVGKPPSELGLMIAQALVGTFLGILLAYGFVGPLANLMETRVAEQSKAFEAVKLTLLASINGYPPPLAVEFGRKVLFDHERPSFVELEEHLRKFRGR